MFVNADFQTTQYPFTAPKNTYALRINFTAPSFQCFSPSKQKLKNVRTGAVWFTTCENITRKKICPFLQTFHLGTLQSELRRCRFGHGSSGARHVVITDWTGKKKMHAVGMSPSGGTFIWRFANIGWLVHQRKWRAKFNIWYSELLLHGSR